MLGQLKYLVAVAIMGWSVTAIIASADDAPPLSGGLVVSDESPDSPSLPGGLNEKDNGPSLPSGLGGENNGPALPGGLGGDKEQEAPPTKESPPFTELAQWIDLSGFWEVRGGVRTQRDPHEKQASLGETRLQLDAQKVWQNITFRVTGDFLYDAVATDHHVNLETGQGWFDLRRANVSLRPTQFMDVKIGRQILTWGTGDLVFINDMFPKDWVSFLIGRDIEYLKAPSDALKTSLYSKLANVDFVYTPRFDPDRYISGRRLSYYNATLGGIEGQNAIIEADVPNEWFRDDEFAARVYKNIGGYELAAYGYWGYWKSPGGQNPVSGNATFPRLNVYGASVQGNFGRGIGNVEVGYYDSVQDRSGDNPLIKNSEFRLLAGYKQDMSTLAPGEEAFKNLTVGFQYYVEWMMDYDAYQRNNPPVSPAADEVRQVMTFRVTKLLMNQNLALSFFAYYSPSDSDAYLRPKISYKIDDHWTAEVGGNVFFGIHDYTFFGQFAQDTNVYAALRYGF